MWTIEKDWEIIDDLHKITTKCLVIADHKKERIICVITPMSSLEKEDMDNAEEIVAAHNGFTGE